MSCRLRRTGCLPLLVLLCSGPWTGQHLPDEATDRYLEAGDRTYLYVAEFGAAAAACDTVVVLHGGWDAEHSYLWPAV